MADLGAGIDRVSCRALSRAPAPATLGAPPKRSPEQFMFAGGAARGTGRRDRGRGAGARRRGGGLLIEGPPGIGKTRLLGAARARRTGTLVLSARGVRARARLSVRGRAAAARAGRARRALRGRGGARRAGAARRGRRAGRGRGAARALLADRQPRRGAAAARARGRHPLGRPASLRWLAYLAQRLDGLPVALIAAARPAEAGEGQPVLDDLAANPSIEVLEPRGLSAAAVGRGSRAPGRARRRRSPPPAPASPAATRSCSASCCASSRTVAPTAANAPLVARQTSRTVSRAALARLRRLPRRDRAGPRGRDPRRRRRARARRRAAGARPATAATPAALEEAAILAMARRCVARQRTPRMALRRGRRA